MRKSCSALTTLGIGSTMLTCYMPENDHELLDYIQSKSCVVLGNGSNILGTDDPLFDLNVVLLSSAFYTLIEKLSNGDIAIGAGTRLHTIAQYGIENALDALIALAGIPATLGGALCMNAGAHGTTIFDHLISLRGFLPTGEEKVFLKKDLVGAYRKSGLPRGFIVTHARFRFEPLSQEAGKELLEKTLYYRRDHQPKERSAGCVFKNPTPQLSAGKLIDECGLKGFSVGGASVSEKHGNFLINLNHATESDFLQLLNHVSDVVQHKKQIKLERELIFIKELKNEN